MKVLSINLGNYSSTGGIAQGIKQEAEKSGIEYVLSYPYDPYNKPVADGDIFIGSRFGRKASIALGMVTGYNGCFSYFATKKLISKIKKHNPDILHFHNLHNNYINLPLLFKFVKKQNYKIVWTLHDCWSFTGQCPYFEMVGCDKWKTGCHSCPNYKEYPKALVDNTKRMWHLKKKWFSGVENLTFVTPAEWLANLVKQSYLQSYPVQVINNGIDVDAFQPTVGNLRETHGLTDKKILLGVAFDWGKRKGLDVFVELAKRLPDDYKIVLVGTQEEHRKDLPSNILALGRTSSREELAQWYTTADLFVNPTRDEVFGLVNVEALACGTPGVTFNSGGSPECYDDTCGVVVPREDIDALEKEIIRICTENPYSKTDCIKKAKEFDKNEKFKEYIELYERVNASGT